LQIKQNNFTPIATITNETKTFRISDSHLFRMKAKPYVLVTVTLVIFV